MFRYLPNLLTISRAPLALLLLVLWSNSFLWTAFLISIIAALTDLYDGLIARKYGHNSDLGALLDPIMDKIYLLIIVIFLYFNYNNSIYSFWIQLVRIWFLAVCIRNVAQLSSVPILKLAKIEFKVKPKPFAKWGTVISFVVISVIFFESALLQFYLDGSAVFFGDKINFNVDLLTGVSGNSIFYFIYNYNKLSLLFLVIISLAFEIWILITFLPRFIQILLGKHDTFN